MWQQRNQMLHNKGNTIHKHETAALDEEICEEMHTGLDELDERFSHLFQDTLQSQLSKTMTQKRMWIMSVWAARDNTNKDVQIVCNRHRDIVMIYNRWRSKNKNNEG
jgi:hypothetical protein